VTHPPKRKPRRPESGFGLLLPVKPIAPESRQIFGDA
jgi:hypothetical protein